MRERSKNAARTRREKENHEFSELARLLPHPSSSTANMDKATVVKLTTAYLKLRNIFPYGLGAPWGSETRDKFLSDHAAFLVKSLEGFLIIMGPNLKITYVSEGVSFYLGLSQTEMMGNNINEYVHMCDHEELKALLNHEETVPVEDRIRQEIEVARSFSLRMKCVLTKRSAGLVIDKYKVIHFRGYLKLKPVSLPLKGTASTNEVRYRAAGIVAVGNAIHPTTSLEVKMYNNTFMYRAELDFKFIHAESRIKELTGYEPQQLLRKSLYKFVHACDSFKLSEDHKKLLEKGQAVSSYYRFLTHSGGWIWIQSSFILLLNSKSRQTFILAINHALSEREHNEHVFDDEQKKAKPGEFKWNEHGHLVAVKRSAVAPEISRKEIPKVKKKSSSFSPGNINSYFDQFTASSSYVRPSNVAMSFANNFQSLSLIQPVSAGLPSTSNLQQINCIQSADTLLAFSKDLPSITQEGTSSHSPASYNDLRGCWYSGENTKYSHTSTNILTQPPVNAVHNSTGYYNLCSTYFGSVSDPYCSSSICLNPYTNHGTDSTAYSGTSNPISVEANSTRFYNNDNSYNAEQQPYCVESVGQNPSHSEPVDDSQLTSSLDNSERSEAIYTGINNNGNSYSGEQQPFCDLPLSQNPSNFMQKYTEQLHNSHLASPEGNSGKTKKGYPYSVLSVSDSFPENSIESLEHIPNFELPRTEGGTEMPCANNTEGEQLQQSSANPYSRTTDNANDQIICMSFIDLCCNEELDSTEATITSLEIASYLPSLTDLNSVSYNIQPLDDKGKNTLTATSIIPETYLSELSPVSANSSLSSDPNNDHVNSLTSSSDYSSGYWEEKNKEHSELNCDLMSSSTTDCRKDFFGFPPFQSRASSTPLYTAL